MSGAPALLSNVPTHQAAAHSAAYVQVLEDTKKRALLYPEKSVMPGQVGLSDSDSDVDSLRSAGGTDQGGGGVGSDGDVGRVDVDSQDSGGEEGEEGEGTASVDSEEEAEEDEEYPTIVWTGYARKVPVVVFKADAIVSKKPEFKTIGEKYHLQFKFMKTDCKVLRTLLTAHGFNEAHPNSNDFNLMWTGSHLKPYVLRSLMEFQKVNHFPRSYEITRKDRLFKNVQRMQQTKGFKHFDFVPMSFIVPGEFQDFCSHFLKDKGPWIVKPIASSRGRGIFLVNHPEQVPLDETLIVSKYIPNPLLIDGFKFDVRLYIGVTSYDPLIVYLYEEGLTRFATVKYEKNVKNIRNTCMHLTNYSVNKKSTDYVKNDDPDVEDYGNKWSLGALLRYLRSQGKDTTAMMMRIEDVIIKTIISAELPIATACKMFQPFKGNCFEVYGFDILIDENLRPWVLEVNLSPSLACDAPIDLKIKSNMLADLFSLVGFVCHDPMMRKVHQGRRNGELNGRASRSQSRPSSSASIRQDVKWRPKNRPGSAGSNKANRPTNVSTARGTGGLTSDEIKIVRKAKEENQRRGGWIRIFPNPDSWELYSSFMQYTTTNNLMLWQQLFPERAKSTMSLKPSTAAYSSTLARAKSVHLHSAQYPQLYISTQDDALAQALHRSLQYERKLSALGDRRRRKNFQDKKSIRKGAPNISTNFKGSLVQGVPEDTMSGPKPVRGESEQTSSNSSLKQTKTSSENSRTEVTGKPPIKKTDSKQSLQSNSSSSQASKTTKDDRKEEINGGGGGGKSSSSSASSKSSQQQENTKSKSESSSNSKLKQQQQLSSKSSESLKNGDSSRGSTKSSSGDTAKQSSSGGGGSNTSKAGGDGGSSNGGGGSSSSAKPPPGNSRQQQHQRDSEKSHVKTREASPQHQYYNVVELLEKGKTMTKVQARHAFATYLTRVQQRLLAESIHTEVDDLDQANEQMDLVLRFLKRAAGNLQQPFKVVVPSRKLALNDRRRILAKQLGEFVHIYNRETEQLRHRNLIDKKCLRKGSSQNTLDEDKFNKFVHTASETELEEVLTTYTKLNKSASIFLGSNSKSTGDKPPPSIQSEASLPRRREQAGEHSEAQDRMTAGGYSSGSVTDLNSDPPGMGSSSSLHRTPSQSSFHSAVAIYSSKLSSQNASLRQRPSSASSQRSTASSKASSLRSRPASASMSWQNEGGGIVRAVSQPMGEREGPDGAASDSTASKLEEDSDIELKENGEVHEEAINSALQRIALRQQQRHYGASKASSVLGGSSTENTPRLQQPHDPADVTNGNVMSVAKQSSHMNNGRAVQTNVDFYPVKGAEYNPTTRDTQLTSASEPAIKTNGRRPSTQNSSRSVKSVRSANDTFQQFVEDSDHSSDRVSAYSQVTGVSPLNRNYTPSFQSTQYQIAQHQMMLKQQRMIEQSKVLLEQSKAKHQAMIAQAHAAHKGPPSTPPPPNGVAIEDTEASFTPKPPTNPSPDKKVVGAHRMARTQGLEEAFTTSQFYNSIKYDTYTGATTKPKIVYSSSYNTGI